VTVGEQRAETQRAEAQHTTEAPALEHEAREHAEPDSHAAESGGYAHDQALAVRAEVLDGPFTTRQLLRLDEALRVADRSTGLTFSVYVGDLDEPVRGHAEKLHGQLADPGRSVLIAVSPNQRLLEIVTGEEARRRLFDRDCKLAALSMAAAFGGGDLAGGIISGLSQLADHAGKS
jgi:hypothetical protein